MEGWGDKSWAKRLSWLGAVVGFVGTLVLFMAHPGLRRWSWKIDEEFFYMGRFRNETGALFGLGAAIVLAIVGYVVGHFIDRRRRPRR